MRCLSSFWFCFALCGWLAGQAQAQTYIEFEFDGQKMMARPMKFSDPCIEIAPQGGGPSKKIPWGHLSQATLKRLESVKTYGEFAKHFIDPPPQNPPTGVAKQGRIQIKPVERMDRPSTGSLWASPITWFAFLLFYVGNIYAGYEIATFRSRNKVMVAGVCAAAPLIGPIIFLAMPTYVEPVAEEATEEGAAEGEGEAATIAGATPAEEAAPVETAPVTPQEQVTVYARGQFTFNRRFFETKMAGFLKVVPGEAEKDMVIVVTSARGSHVGTRFVRLSPNDLTLLVVKGPASQEVVIPFTEINEVKIRHKDAA